MIEKSVIETIADHLGVDDVTRDQQLRDLGADSIDVLQVLMALEDRFDVSFENQSVDHDISVSYLITEVEKKLS